MKSETRVGKMRTRDAHKQGVKSIKHFFNNILFSLKTGLAFIAQLPRSSNFSFLLILLRA